MPESNISSVMSLLKEMNTKIDTMAEKIDVIENAIGSSSNAHGEALYIVIRTHFASRIRFYIFEGQIIE